ncbi:hypothetical protein [Actinocatenispora rupis]|uniref:Ankyrin n=1 Tax=Actinocatenispora rupis TaxID=519421 RepID=A0A8J3ND45_9ACTN|nr:hypothetical protein [Actinocatenispora rupis]GID12487.1 hypothetical protein Aru02nite_33760 [Actinocatenispora rupis]
MPGFAGAFETHLTLRFAADADETRARAWARAAGVKYTRIVLDRGARPDQPMLTAHGRGVLADRVAAAREMVASLRADGFAVTRLKVEAAPGNADVPRTAADAAALPPGCYFEHHVKLALADTDVPRVRALAEPYAAHVSRNPRRARDDGRHERFVTQRCRGVGRPEARRRLDALLAALSGAGFGVVEVEEEFVVFDDNPELDAGWIDERAGR